MPPSMRKAKNGRYYVFWSEGRQSHRESLGVGDELEAQERFARWILRRVAARRGIPPEKTISEYWSVYLDKHVNTDAVMPKGRETIAYAWKNLEPHFGKRTIDEFTQELVDAYVAARLRGKIGRKSKPVTVRRELVSLNAALNFCSKWYQMFERTRLRAVRLPSEGRPREQWLDLNEMQRLLDAAADCRQGSRLSRGEKFIWLALETGARLQAILDLEWSRVHFDVGTIEFDVPGRKRTKKYRATVPISASLRPVLERAFQERVIVLPNGRKHEETHVMENQGAIWPIVQRIAIRAGFSAQKTKGGTKPRATGISPHVLRHSAATLMARRGVPLWAIGKILGNSVAMVERVYAKWVGDDAPNTVDKISGGLLKPPRP